jgi:hypothetical protein
MVRQNHSVALPRQVSLVQVVDGARRAVQDLMCLARTELALSDWVSGPYHQATKYGPRRVVTGTRRLGTPEAIGDVIARAQHEVRLAARGALMTDSRDFIRKLPPVVHVLPAHDTSGARGFIPLDAQGASLGERAVALLLADYLTRPSDFTAAAFWHEVTAAGRDLPTQPAMQAVRLGTSKT